MLYKEYIKLDQLFIHKIGNKANMEGVTLSDNAVTLSPLMAELLKSYFLLAFKDDCLYSFTHANSLDLNVVRSYAVDIFEKGGFHNNSKEIAKHLYESSDHPNIKSGELYVAYFKNCILDGETVDAIGIFKSENKDTFIRVNAINGGYSVESLSGVNMRKLDKGCLIFNTRKGDGYVISVVDNSNSSEAKYWIDNFLQVKRLNDSFAQTQNAVAMCKSFISQLPDDVAKSDKAAMMNRVIEGMKSEHVVLEDLAAHAFGQDVAASGFKAFKDDYEAMHDVRFDESFQSKPEAIKRRATGSMTTIKLDKYFDVCIHGGEQFIERGYDEEKCMRYYKLYFNEEK